jgi:hypothetical protein
MLRTLVFSCVIFGFCITQASTQTATSLADFCNDDDLVVCDGDAVRTLERLAKDANTARLKDLYVLFVAGSHPLQHMGGARMMARAIDRRGDRQAALELLLDAQSAVFSSSDWMSNFYAMAGIAEQRHALGDKGASEDLANVNMYWPDHYTAFDRASMLLILAKSLFKIGDTKASIDMFEKAHREALKAPLRAPPNVNGDRIESLSYIWVAADYRGLSEITESLSAEITDLLLDTTSYRQERGTWPLTVEDFRAGPPGVSRIPE